MPSLLPYAILYRSRAVAMLEWEVGRLALHSAMSNARCGITGLLLYAPPREVGSGTFLQWIEGSVTEVEALFAVIRADPRHRDIEVVARGETAQLTGEPGRLFPTWAMDFQSVDALPTGLNAFVDLGRTHHGGVLDQLNLL